jgi:phosphatidylinositol alpha-mannosyltransferase
MRQLGQQLVARGHEVLILAPARAHVAGVQVVGRPLAVPYQGTVAPICFSLRSARRTGAALRAFRPDVVHAHEPLTPSTGMLATLRSPAPVVATFHAHAERSALFSTAVPLLRPVWRRIRVRVAVSEAAAKFVATRMGDGIRIVPNGCDVDAFAGATAQEGLPEGRRLLWVNRLDRQKGFGVALAAFELLIGRFPDARLIVVGDGPDRSLLGHLPPAVRAKVHLAGTVDHEAVPAYHAASDLFVAPPICQESFGMVLVEAMAAGRPVVATDIAGYREVVRDGREGLLVPPRDPEALAAAMGRVLGDSELAASLGEAGRARAERYRWDRVVDELEQAYADGVTTGPR